MNRTVPAPQTTSAADTRRLLRQFDRYAGRFRPVLERRFGREQATAIVTESRQEFAALLPTIPFIGGRRNPLRFNLETSAMFLALERVLRRRGLAPAEIGRLVYAMTRSWLRAYPAWVLRLLGWWRFTPWYQRMLRRRAAASQARRYPGDWVFCYVPGDGRSFDWGVDYSECAILKFYETHGAGEFVPYLCALDYPMSEASGSGLVRRHTLAEGAPCCDFRFKRGRRTVAALPWQEPNAER